MKVLADLIHWLIGSGLRKRHNRSIKAMHISALKRPSLAVIAALILLAQVSRAAAAGAPEANSSESDEIINQYLQATEMNQEALRGASMEVQIDAAVPQLKEHGRLYALRKISKVGHITYHVVRFQGANTVKKEVIARYLQAEQQGQQSSQSFEITPANYKFKYKGEKATDQGTDAYVFQLCPRQKRVGLFKGEIWLDSHTYLPIYEKGRLVKNPSIFFKKVDFQRTYAIQNGLPIPQYMATTIDTRLVGKIELNVSYSKFSQRTTNAEEEGEPDEETISTASSQ